MKRDLTIGTLVLVAALIVPTEAVGQGRILRGLTWDRELFTGSPDVLEQYGAQTRLSSDNGFATVVLDGDRRRFDIDGLKYTSLFNWDIAFSISEEAVVGARFQLSYLDSPSLRWVGPELAGAVIRFRVADGTSGPKATIGVAAGQQFRDPGGTLLELDGIVGFEPSNYWRFDLGAVVSAHVIGDQDNAYAGSFALGPIYKPIDVLSFALDVAGRIGNRPLLDDLFWDLTAALRIGVTIGWQHELAVAVRRTLIGSWVDEETGLTVVYRFRWMTEDGFLRLDDDGGPPPEPPEWQEIPDPVPEPVPEPEPVPMPEPEPVPEPLAEEN